MKPRIHGVLTHWFRGFMALRLTRPRPRPTHPDRYADGCETTMEVSCPVAPADDWVVRTAGEVRAEAMRRHPGEAPTCASGISPSGPVHLGNLRELMVPHLVADEIRKQGVPARHILS